jgi:signal transduction histidine kinase
MNEPGDRPLSLACVGDQASSAAALHEALLVLFPGATIREVDTAVERGLPDAIECAVIDATRNGTDGIEVLRRLRARGYDGAAVIVVDSLRTESIDEPSADRLGARYCGIGGELLTPLATAVSDAVRANGLPEASGSKTVLRALRQTQRLLAAGELAMRLQHSLNNPLAALLAEAQLLELERLEPEHRGSVERIIELSRRVIDVVRGLDGVGRA